MTHTWKSMQGYPKDITNTTALTTTSVWAAYEQCDYLSHLNYKLVNEVNDAETEKYFFKNKLQNQYKSHTCEISQLYATISQKNDVVLHLEEGLDKMKKDYRMLEDECCSLRNNSISDKEFYEKEMENMKRKSEQKIKAMEEKLEKQYELKLGRRVAEVERQCEERVKMFKGQIETLTENSNQLTHELKLMQDKYRDMMLKNDLIIQQSINRELRKRDFEAQNNYLRDVSQYEAIVREKRELKEALDNALNKIKLLNSRNNELEGLIEVERTKYHNLEEAFEEEMKDKKRMEQKFINSIKSAAETTEMDVNTDQQFVPVVMPVDLDLISEIVSLKEFVVEKIVERFLELFCKTATTESKKKSNSLTTFKNSLQVVKEMNPEIKILLYFQSNLERIIKVYCPSMNYTREYLTVKDDFIKRTLMECQTITNSQQKLYRILELIHRLKHPMTHSKNQVSAGELRMVEIKLLSALKKVFAAQ